MEDQIKEQNKEQARKRRVRASIRMFVIGFVLAALLCVGYCLVTGRFMSAEEYKFYKEYRTSYGKYYDLMNFLDKKALGKYEASELDDNVYRDIIASLDDPYAEYYTADEFANFEKRFAESYVGIGIAVGDLDGKVVIASLMDEAPAKEAGIKPGDIIVKVDGKKVKDSTDATSKIAGDVGTDVTVTIDRDGTTKDFTVTRQKIVDSSVKYSKLDEEKKIGYIQLTLFKEGTTKEFKNAVKDLKNDGYEKFVIDLRNNGGGSTIEAYKLADYLLPEGEIVSIKNKKGKARTVKSDAGRADFEYVVLVNENTASASEIVSCAIQDNDGGMIIGSKTYGKGVTQQTHTLPDGSVVKVTIEEYLRPNGDKVNGVGITPDITVKDPLNNEEIMPMAIKMLSK